MSVEQIGTVCWGPVPFLTPEALAYYLPRLMELALQGVKNKDGGPFFMQFLNQIGLHSPSEEQFSLLDQKQKELVHRCIEELGNKFSTEIEDECGDDWLAEAKNNWRT